MLSGFIALLKATFRTFLDGVKTLLGVAGETDSMETAILSSKACAAAIAFVAFVLLVLPFPALRGFSDSLFRVSNQLWGAPLGRIA